MTPPDDTSLLREFATRDSQAAFTELVKRHLDLVYSAALRQVNGDSGLAADVSQAVFTDLGRKARSFPPNVVLPAWLHRATRLAALAALRAKARRAHREREAVQMHELEHGAADADWGSVRPVIDEALDQLNENDREAVLRRYFQKQSFGEISAALSVSEDAARMRVERALDKLRDLLAKRGVTSTGAALSALLAAQSVSAAPAGLAIVIATTAATALAQTTLITTLTIMTAPQIKTGVAVLAAAGVLAWTSREHLRNRDLAAQLESLRSQTGNPVPSGPTGGTAGVDAGDLKRLRAEHQELLRLRGEVAALRKEQASVQPPPPPATGDAASDNEPARDAAQEAGRTAVVARLNYAAGWAAALLTYASKNDGLMPKTFTDAQDYYPALFASTMSAFDPGKFEILYRGVINEVLDPPRTVIMREKEAFSNPGKPGWSRTYVFADGHTEMHHSPDGNYAEWESRLVIQPSGQKARP